MNSEFIYKNRPDASMGPRLQERGVNEDSWRTPFHPAASMGPRLQERGVKKVIKLFQKMILGFNGAALTRARSWGDAFRIWISD